MRASIMSDSVASPRTERCAVCFQEFEAVHALLVLCLDDTPIGALCPICRKASPLKLANRARVAATRLRKVAEEKKELAMKGGGATAAAAALRELASRQDEISKAAAAAASVEKYFRGQSQTQDSLADALAGIRSMPSPALIQSIEPYYERLNRACSATTAKPVTGQPAPRSPLGGVRGAPGR